MLFYVARGAAEDARGVRGVVCHEAPADFAARRVANHNAVAARKAAFHPRHAGRQQALAFAQRFGGAGVEMRRALWLQRAGDPFLARGDGIGGRQEPAAAARRSQMRESGAGARPSAITIWAPPIVAILAASILVRIPPREYCEAAPPAIASISAVMRGMIGR